MKFWFCDSCGKRITEEDLELGRARDKKLKGVYCVNCAIGVSTVDAMPIRDTATARAIILEDKRSSGDVPVVKKRRKNTEPAPVTRSARPRSSGRARAEPAPGNQSAQPSQMRYILGAIGALIVVLMLLLMVSSGTKPRPTPQVAKNDDARQTPETPLLDAPPTAPPHPPLKEPPQTGHQDRNSNSTKHRPRRDPVPIPPPKSKLQKPKPPPEERPPTPPSKDLPRPDKPISDHAPSAPLTPPAPPKAETPELGVATLEAKPENEPAAFAPKKAAVSNLPPGASYLADMQEREALVGWKVLGKRTLNWAQMIVNRKPVENGLFMHPPSNGMAFAMYPLDGQYRTFKAGCGFNHSSSSPRPKIWFEVYGDDKKLWSSKILNQLDQTDACELNISGVQVLKIAVNCQGLLINAHAIWIDPFVAKAGPADEVGKK